MIRTINNQLHNKVRDLVPDRYRFIVQGRLNLYWFTSTYLKLKLLSANETTTTSAFLLAHSWTTITTRTRPSAMPKEISSLSESVTFSTSNNHQQTDILCTCTRIKKWNCFKTNQRKVTFEAFLCLKNKRSILVEQGRKKKDTFNRAFEVFEQMRCDDQAHLEMSSMISQEDRTWIAFSVHSWMFIFPL